MTFATLIALPCVLIGIIYALYRSGLPKWLKFLLIAVLAIFLARVIVAVVGVLSV